MSKRIVLTGGGTAGHVTPNLALIPRLLEDGWEVHYIGEADGAEGYVLKVEAGGSHCLTALVTYAGGVYVEKGGAFALSANWK